MAPPGSVSSLAISLLASILLLVTIGVQGQQAKSSNVALTSDLSLSWLLTAKSPPTIIFQLEYQGSAGWLGIGWHLTGPTKGLMTNADFAVGIWDDTKKKMQVNDRCSDTDENGFTQPLLDTDVKGGKDNIIWGSGTRNSSYTSVVFERALVTNDTVADHPLNPSEDTMFVWAHGDSSSDDPFQFHGPKNRGALLINLAGGTTKQVNSNLPYLHGCLMILGFAFCMCFGIFVARYLKQYYWWFPLHIFLQVSGVVMAISGFIVALVMIQRGSGDHFAVVHSWFGVSILALAVITPGLGWASDLAFDPNRHSVPVWPDKVHWWFGRLTVVGAFVTIILGMKQLGVSNVFEWTFGTFIFLFAVIFIGIELYRWRNNQAGDDGHHSLSKEKAQLLS